MKEGGDGRNLLVQPYPIELTQHAFHRPQHRQHSSRRRLGHRPIICGHQPGFPSYNLRFPNGHFRSGRAEVGRSLADAYLWECSLGEDAVAGSVENGYDSDITYINKQVLPQA